jgi:hypothetical protein
MMRWESGLSDHMVRNSSFEMCVSYHNVRKEDDENVLMASCMGKRVVTSFALAALVCTGEAQRMVEW